MRIKSLIAIALVLGAPFVPTAPAATDIKVLCASGMREIVSELQTRLGQVAGQPMSVSFGEAGDLQKRIQGGEIADVAILPRIVLDQVAADGNVVSGRSSISRKAPSASGFARTDRYRTSARGRNSSRRCRPPKSLSRPILPPGESQAFTWPMYFAASASPSSWRPS